MLRKPSPKSWLLLSLCGLLFLEACQWSSPRDLYTELVEICKEPGPGGTMISPSCQTALERTIPLSPELSQSQDAKQALLQSIWYLLYVPMAYPPDYHILGHGPHSLPLKYMCLYPQADTKDFCPDLSENPPKNLNQVLLNYLLNSIDEITYLDGPKVNYYARYELFGSKRRIALGPSFGQKPLSLPWYAQIAILLHEAHHAHVSYHVDCQDGRGYACDNDFTGSYGLEAIVLEWILHGSDQQRRNDQAGWLSREEVQNLGIFVCERTYYHILSANPLPLSYEETGGCFQAPLAVWEKRENLLPFPPIAPTPPPDPKDER